MYIVKYENVPVSDHNIDKELVYGNLNNSILNTFDQIVRDVYAPILCKPTKKWPYPVRKQVDEAVKNLVANIQIAKGYSEAMTYLPLPPERDLMGDIEYADLIRAT